MKKVLAFLPIRPLLTISILYSIVSLILFAHYGVKYVNDTERYLEYAQNLKAGFYFDPHNFWYIGYVSFVLFVQLVFHSLLAQVVIQYILYFFALLAIYQTSLLLFDDKLSALVAAIGMILFIEMPMWNSYLLAESLYTACICFSLLRLAQWWRTPSGLNLFLAMTAVLFTFLIKPTGIALLISTSAVVYFLGMRRIHSPVNRWGISLLSVIGFTLLINRMLTTFLILENYQSGEVIYAVTTTPVDTAWLTVATPSPLFVPPADQPPLLRVISFIFHHPVYWSKLFLAKTGYFLFHIRPYWSWVHNVFSLVFLLPVYYFATKAIRSAIETPVIIFAITYILFHVISIGVTSEDWDGRFLAPVLPVVFLLAGKGISTRLQR
jgi:hypothetical protein